MTSTSPSAQSTQPHTPTALESGLSPLGHGLPYHPRGSSPHTRPTGKILIGDVGFLDNDGYLIRLFNACGNGSNEHGVPDGFVPLRIPIELFHDVDEYLQPGVIPGRNLHVVDTQDLAHPSTPHTMKIKPSGDNSSFLILQSQASRTYVKRNRTIPLYIRQHRTNWHRFAQSLGYDVPKDDLILVKGVVSTRGNWCFASCEGRDLSGEEISIEVNYANQGEGWCEISHRQSSSVPLQVKKYDSASDAASPREGNENPIFLSFYKAKSRSILSTSTSHPIPEGSSTSLPVSNEPTEEGEPVNTELTPGPVRAGFAHDIREDHVDVDEDEDVGMKAGDDDEREQAVARPERTRRRRGDDVPMEMQPEEDSITGTSESGREQGSNAEETSEPSKYLTFVDSALEFILSVSESTSSQIAITSDEDVYETLVDLGGRNSWPANDDIFAFLKAHSVDLSIDSGDGFAILSLRDVVEKHNRERLQAQAEELDALDALQVNVHEENGRVVPVTVNGNGNDAEEGQADEPTPEYLMPDETQHSQSAQPSQVDGEPSTDIPNPTHLEDPTQDPTLTKEAESRLRTLDDPDLHEDVPPVDISNVPHIIHLGSGLPQVGMVCSMTVSPNSQYVVAGFEDNAIRLWRLSTGVMLKKLEGHTEYVVSLAFSPDSTTLVSASLDGIAIVWDVASGEVVGYCKGHEKGIWSVAYSPDGSVFATGSLDGKIRLWDPSPSTIDPSSLSIHQLFEISNGSAIVRPITFSPDSQLLASTCFDVVKIWNPQSGELVCTLEGHDFFIWGGTFSSDSKRIVSSSDDKSMRVWDARSGDELVTIQEHTGPVWNVDFSGNGELVLSGSSDTSIVVANSFTGEKRHLLRYQSAAVNSARFSPNGRYVVAGYANGIVDIWDACHDGTLLAELKGHDDKVKNVLFSPDGKWIVSCSDDGAVRSWNVEDVFMLVPIRD
ncbi:WD40 repeat-like protein [Panus rudis PR-1116 ss-1]|nr:WD40 repeat-like protein [Panus rudis PR-1116 ss-1]